MTITFHISKASNPDLTSKIPEGEEIAAYPETEGGAEYCVNKFMEKFTTGAVLHVITCRGELINLVRHLIRDCDLHYSDAKIISYDADGNVTRTYSFDDLGNIGDWNGYFDWSFTPVPF